MPDLSLAALLLSASLLSAGNGLIQTYLPLHMAEDGFSSTAIGIMVTGHAAGFLLGCVRAPGMIRRVGHIRAFVATAAAMSVASLAFAAGSDAVWWSALRLVTGFSSATMFTAVESWLNARTTRATRGSVIGIYMVANKVFLIGGQLMVALPLASWATLMLASGIYSFSLIPLATTRSVVPDVSDAGRFGLRELYAIAPTAFAGCLVAGLVNSAVIGLAPLYATWIAMDPALVGVVAASMQGGALLLQWPMGRLSDRMDRRRAILLAAGGALGASVLLALGERLPMAALFPAFALWGGFSLSMYALSIGHANDLAEPEQLVGLSSSLLLIWGIGAIAGPMTASALMDRFGAGALFGYAAAMSALLILFVLGRMVVRAGGERRLSVTRRTRRSTFP